MRRNLAPIALAILALAAPPAVRAQSNTAETLEGAVRLYEELQVERALVMLRQVISPNSPFEVSRAQRVEAYKYLGASLAILGMRDSALVYFRAALERDPFVDLDESTFTLTERTVFAEARRASFSLGIKPLQPARIDPATESFTFPFVATHGADVRVMVRAVGDSVARLLVQRAVDGASEVRWNGLRGDGRLGAAGRYELTAIGRSLLSGAVDSSVVFFDLRLERPELEDTLPTLGSGDLLAERQGRSAAGMDLMRGVGLAAAALLMPRVIGRGGFGTGGNGMLVGTVAVAATAVGVAASLDRQRHPEITENVIENRRRRAERAAANAEIVRRNAARVALTKLVITPAAGLEQ
jgi:hypothetical protein